VDLKKYYEYSNENIRPPESKKDGYAQGSYNNNVSSMYGNDQSQQVNFQKNPQSKSYSGSGYQSHSDKQYRTPNDSSVTRGRYPVTSGKNVSAQYNWKHKRKFNKDNEESIMEFFGFIPTLPSLNNAWFISIVILIMVVELDIYLNILNNEYFGNQSALFGVTILGVFMGAFFSYVQYEFVIWKQKQHNNPDRAYMNLLKIIVLVVIGCIVTAVVIVQIISFREKVGIIDCLGILAVGCGTYNILVKNRLMMVPTVLIIIIIGALKINYSTDIILLTIFSGLLLFYILIFDTSIQYYHSIKEIRGLYKEKELKRFDNHIDRIFTKYLIYLFVFVLVSTLILGFLYLLNIFRMTYFPEFIRENIEFQTIYGLIGPFILFLTVVYTLWIFKRYDILTRSKKLIWQGS
jgi:hypothetical protein